MLKKIVFSAMTLTAIILLFLDIGALFSQRLTQAVWPFGHLFVFAGILSQTLFFFVFFCFSNRFHRFVLEANENRWFSNEKRQKVMKTNGFHCFVTEMNENHWFSLLSDAFH